MFYAQPDVPYVLEGRNHLALNVQRLQRFHISLFMVQPIVPLAAQMANIVVLRLIAATFVIPTATLAWAHPLFAFPAVSQLQASSFSFRTINAFKAARSACISKLQTTHACLVTQAALPAQGLLCPNVKHAGTTPIPRTHQISLAII